MKKIKFRKTFLILVLVLTPVLTGLAMFPAKTALAASCNYEPGGAGGAGLVNLSTRFGAIDSTAQKLGAEFTPSQSWNSAWSAYISSIGFAKAGCVNANANVSFSVSGSSLTIYTYNQTHSGSYVSGTDYNNLASGVAVSGSPSGTNATFTYTMPTISTNTAQLLSVDIGTTSGWADIYLKQGTGSENRLMSIKLPTGVTSFMNKYQNSSGLFLSSTAFDVNSCSAISGSGGALVRALADGTALSQTVYSGSNDECSSFNKSSYNSSTKTANLNYQTAGITPNHKIKSGTNSINTVGGDYLGTYSTIETGTYAPGEYFPKDSLTSSVSSSQQVYFITQAGEDGKSTPKDAPYPLAGAVFNLSSSDIDIADVKLDISEAQHASLAHGLGAKTVGGVFSLFASQQEGDEFVGVCPGADTLDDVNTTCANIYFLKDGETKNGATASLVTVGDVKFWKVDGLTGTGVFSSTVGEIPGVANTGLDKNSRNIGFSIIGFVGVAIVMHQVNTRRKSLRRR